MSENKVDIEKVIEMVETWINCPMYSTILVADEDERLVLSALKTLYKENERLRRLLKAKEQLLTSYRLGSQKMADRALTQIEKLEALGGKDENKKS